MIYADVALGQLREACSKYAFDEENISDKLVLAKVTSNGISTEVSFDVEKQTYSFKLFQGGSKNFSNIEEFIKLFDSYMDCYSVLVPTAKHIVQYLESDHGFQTIFDTVTGNSQSGYKAKFQVVGTNESILVYKFEDYYRADWVELSSDKTEYWNKDSFLYDSSYNNVLTYDFFIERLLELYKDDESYMLTREVGDTEDSDIYSMMTDRCFCTMSFIVEPDGVTVKPIKVNFEGFDLDCDSILFPLKNSFSLEEIEDKIKEYAEEQITRAEAELTEDNEVKDVVEINDTDLEDFDIPNEDVEEVKDTEEPMPDVEEQEVQSNEGTEDSVPVVEGEEPSNTYVESDDKSECEDGAMTLLKIESTNPGVLIHHNGKLYTISAEVAKSVGIPVSRLVESTKETVFRGICMTDYEKEHKMFAVSLDNDVDMLKAIWSDFFC